MTNRAMQVLSDALSALLTGHRIVRAGLRDLSAERFPGRDAEALAWSAQYLLWIVHPASGGRAGRPVRAAPVPADAEPDAVEKGATRLLASPRRRSRYGRSCTGVPTAGDNGAE